MKTILYAVVAAATLLPAQSTKTPDFTGVWGTFTAGRGGGGDPKRNPPPAGQLVLKPEYAKPYEARRAVEADSNKRGEQLATSGAQCIPYGVPTMMSVAVYPVEIVQLQGRMIQFYDFFYTHRTIWTDGRKLAEDPEPAWYGYAVGRWEGDTFIVDSYGFDQRSWLDADGHPHSDEMRLQERYRRIDHDTIEETMTLTDPMAYTKPWVSKTLSFKWSPKEVMREDLCAPSDESKYKDEVRTPAGTK